MIKLNKDVKKILLVLAFYAFAGGVFYNFEELWMAQNQLSVKTISIVFSICSLLSVSVIFLCSNLITQKRIKKFLDYLLIIKGVNLFLLFLLNNTGFLVFIKFLVMIDYVVDVEIYACIYPLITLIVNDDKTYAVKDLVYSAAYYLGVFLSSFLLGKSLGHFQITYNIYCFIGSIFIFLSLFVSKSIHLDAYYLKLKEVTSNNELFRFIKGLKKDIISQTYFCFTLFGEASYACVTGLFVTILTSYVGFSPQQCSDLGLILGFLSVGLGSLILSKLTLKNDYINLSIKYVGRFIFYSFAFLFPSRGTILLALMYVKIISDSYSHITDAPYVNRIACEHQLAFYNLDRMVVYLGSAVGLFFCGLVIDLNIKYVFLVAGILVFLQTIFGYLGIYLRKKEKMVLSHD